eukprot:8500433-Karenia_brevis.AAC.1
MSHRHRARVSCGIGTATSHASPVLSDSSNDMTPASTMHHQYLLDGRQRRRLGKRRQQQQLQQQQQRIH